MNDWVKEKTNGKIAKIIDKFDPLCLMMILNAIYFHDEWEEEFDPKKTSSDHFYLSNKKYKKVKFMYHKFEDVSFFQNYNYQAIKLLYKNTQNSANNNISC